MLLSNGTFTAAGYGDLQPAYAQQYYYSGQGLALANSFATYGAVYKAQPWIATLVNKIAYAQARLPLKVYERGSDDNRTEARNSPYANLLRNPNPRHDPFFLQLWTVSTHEVYGEAIWVKVRPAPGKAPTQIWPLHPANVLTRRDETGNLKYRYIYGASGDKYLEWDAADIVHFKTYNPDDQVRGLSRLEPLRQTILNEDAARRAAGAMWSNGGRPSMTVTHPGEMSQTAQERLGAQLRGIHSGVDNWGKIAVLEEGMTAQIIPLNAEEMQYIESRKISREEACGVYDVAPPVVHILDHATFSNITEQFRSQYRDTMAPRLALFESVLDAQLRPDFDPSGRTYAEFLLDEVLRGAFEQRAVANQAAIFSGQRTPNEARKQDNLPPLEGGDKLYINAGAIPLEATGQSPAPGENIVVHPQIVKGLEPCEMCGTHTKTSARGLCRGCEGKVGRMLTNRKEIGA